MAGRTEPDSGSRTAAARMAEELAREVAERGWPVGGLLGSEADLCRRFAVGKGVVREASRILEVRGIAHRRRGPGGGLVVDEPDPVRLAQAFEVFIDYRGVSSSQLIEIWRSLEMLAVDDLVRTLDEAGVARLRAAVADPPPPGPVVRIADLNDVHTDFADLCSNPAIGIFLRVVVALCRQHGYDEVDAGAAQWLHRSMSDLVEAVVGGDGSRAQYLARRYIDRIARIGAVNDSRVLAVRPAAEAPD
ncbi:GntR family transcriptional regulator [Pseudonocardia sp. NPDC049154]|uniref:FadR/GntR family transcriptional regulator n=1 Tax=Pseudonocardia sp. NPDC049154 TaxID=3155501 RepID=UPI0033DAA935